MSIDGPNSITRSPEWAIDSLAVGGRGLRLGIPDTILFKDGAPQSWLFTSKSGEVLKKRSLRKSSIRDRFLRLFANNPNNPQQRVATVRSMDGTVRNLDKDSFEGVMTKFPATEPEVVSMQCYVQGKGNAGTVYRNFYRVVNDKGLVVTRTSSFTTLSALHSVDPPPICSWSERDIKMEKCNAPSISKALDKVTQGVVRFIEAEQDRPTRILHAHFDYVVDDFGRIWLTWIGETTTAVGKAAQDLRMARVKIEGPHGKGDFLGLQTALAMNQEFGGPPAPVKKKCRLKHVAAAASASLSGRGEDIIEAIDRAAEITELPRGAVGAGGAGGIADALSRAGAVKEAPPLSSSALSLIASSPTSASVVAQDQGAVKRSQARVLSTMTVAVRVGETSGDRSGGISCGDGRGYPGSFACVGDYCSIRVLDPREDADDPQRKRDPNNSLLDLDTSEQDLFSKVASRLFSGQELSTLRRDETFRRQIEEGLVIKVDSSTNKAHKGHGGNPSDPLPTARTTGRGPRSKDGRQKDGDLTGGMKDRDPRVWYEVPWKSIILARNEKNHRQLDRVEGDGSPEAQGGAVQSRENEVESKLPLPQDRGRIGRHDHVEQDKTRSENGRGGIKDRNSWMLRETNAGFMRQHARKREDGVLRGGAQNFYKPVRVCESCFRVYTLLDKARGILARQAALASEEVAARERFDFVDPGCRAVLTRHRRQRSDRRQLGPHGSNACKWSEGNDGDWFRDTVSLNSDETLSYSNTAARLPGMRPPRPHSHNDKGSCTRERRERSYPDGVDWSDPGHNLRDGDFRNGCGGRRDPKRGWGETRTWKSHLQGTEQMRREHRKEPMESSIEMFENLDDYLRECSETAPVKRTKRKRERFGGDIDAGGSSCVTGGRGSIVTNGGSMGPEEANRDGEEAEGGELFRARLLLAESDVSSAKKMKETLESAGYMVMVERDGRQVVDILIEGDGEWDALLVDRDLPVMDGFAITAALRDFERARRNRTSAARAVAVEEHNRRGVQSSGHGIEKHVRAPSSVPEAHDARQLPIICVTSKASPEDLHSYMVAGMDGCVSKPAESKALLSTLRAAIPLHMSPVSPIDGRHIVVAYPRNDAGAGGGRDLRKGKGLGVLKGSTACAAAGRVLPAKRGNDSVEGALQVDADTSVPYCVLGAPPPTPSEGSSSFGFFNLVICHDLFDSYERMKIVVLPLIARYPGAQVLLWNYPGQAFSKWRKQQLLNNEYLATVLQFLFLHLGKKSKGGTGHFDSDRPYHLVGFGSGGAVATFYASHFASPCPRSLILLNSFSYVDAHLAGVLHDCVNVFGCAPDSRPDLPVYFHARFLFSPTYLSQVSTPLALNIYTAVHNPISVKGRIQLCRGALAHVDTRPMLPEIDVPVICIHSTQNNFVKPLHTDPYVTRRGGEVRSIHKALQDPSKTCVVWLNAGHEIFQEAKAQTTTLLEQAIAGYHEWNDVVCVMSHSESIAASGGDSSVKWERARHEGTRCAHGNRVGAGHSGGRHRKSASRPNYEDGYIDDVLSAVKDVEVEARYQDRGKALRSPSYVGDGGYGESTGKFDPVKEKVEGSQAVMRQCSDDKNDGNAEELGSTWDESNKEVYCSSWESYRRDVAAAAGRGACSGKVCVGNTSEEGGRWRKGFGTAGNRSSRGRRRRDKDAQGGRRDHQGRDVIVRTVLDISHPAFERQDNLVYGFGRGSKVYPQPEEFPEVKEYMAWRLKRNRRRLVRLERAARRIQGAFRAHLAWTRSRAMREYRACVNIQRIFRGWRGRLIFLERLRLVWAAQVVQRNWRGHTSRLWFQVLHRQQASCGHLQRVWRGAIARRRTRGIRNRRHKSAALMQALWRGVTGRCRAFRFRDEKRGAMTIQRAFRGLIGRRRAGLERDKYLFSKSQSQGLEFGRQMLLEHKLHATRLQSDVQLLTGEKIAAEEEVEAMMEEISEFEEAVAVLEREMHQLSKIETEAIGVLNEEARIELREQKVRLDKEFGEMLNKIADRKDRLLGTEKKLATLNRARLGKEEELRMLERKLVVLLEEQQRELESIRHRQEKKGELLVNAYSVRNGGSTGDIADAGAYGPSARDKRQAAQLMQSTETLMKFGFMSMSMTYFSSLNMIRAMRSVGASDTVMAALAQTANIPGTREGGGGVTEDSRALALEQNEKIGAEPFRPALKPGQLPGQEPLAVSTWSVDDVARWLQTLALTQYREAFTSAAVDGAFLYDLNEDDLKNSLGVEHRLHRKKIVKSILRLKAAETERTQQLSLSTVTSNSRDTTLSSSGTQQQSLDQSYLSYAAEALGRPETSSNAGSSAGAGTGSVSGVTTGSINFEELSALTRRGKYKQIREIIKPLPNRRFDKSAVRVQYVADNGTVYVDAYEQEPFNLNKTDNHGNTLLTVAAQNGNLKIAKLYISKGANPDHQNKVGQTAGHYSTSYQFFEFSEWLFLQDGTGAGADDTIENSYGLGAYDGLQPEASQEAEGNESLILQGGG